MLRSYCDIWSFATVTGGVTLKGDVHRPRLHVN